MPIDLSGFMGVGIDKGKEGSDIIPMLKILNGSFSVLPGFLTG